MSKSNKTVVDIKKQFIVTGIIILSGISLELIVAGLSQLF